MRIFVFIYCVFCGLSALGQNENAKPITTKSPDIYVIDNIWLNQSFVNTFSDNDILNKRVGKSTWYGDTVYITIKDHRKLQKMLRTTGRSLAQIARQNIADLGKHSSVIFFRNDSLLTDTAHVKISSLTVFKTDVLRARKTSYYENFPETTFLYIYTKPQPVYIR